MWRRLSQKTRGTGVKKDPNYNDINENLAFFIQKRYNGKRQKISERMDAFVLLIFCGKNELRSDEETNRHEERMM